ADAMRWFLISGNVMHGGDLIVSTDGSDIRDVVRLAIKPIWNAYHFFTLYANADGVQARSLLALSTTDHQSSTSLMDRYILAKCRQAVEMIDSALAAFDTPHACQAVQDFFEVLNNWYIRRSRDRFWRAIPESGSDIPDSRFSIPDSDKQAAYDTLLTVLQLMCRAAAPLLPLTLEAVWQGLQGGESASLHLQDFPEVSAIPEEADLMADMDRVRDVCTAALAVRSRANAKVRQPLASLTFLGAGAERLKPFAALIADEINVKQVQFSDALEGVAERTLAIFFPVAGKRLGGKMKAVAGAARQGNWQVHADGAVEAGGEMLQDGEYEIKLEAKPGIKGAQALSSNDALVVLDLAITPELKAEGIARDIVRLVQEARKAAGLHISDTIRLAVEGPDTVRAALEANRDYVQSQTLAEALSTEDAANETHVSESALDGLALKIGLSKAA
ncbi:MAG: class I tRNA ligase family protein, partial [Rickettsiales bacterium]|nr:class I tRNA ligase family protein [Rickettsiales bacterium]